MSPSTSEIVPLGNNIHPGNPNVKGTWLEKNGQRMIEKLEILQRN